MINQNPLMKIIQGIENLKQEEETNIDYNKVAEFLKKRNSNKNNKTTDK